MQDTKTLRERRRAVVPRGVPEISDIEVDRAEGSYLIDVSGRRVLDLATGIGVMSVGHTHPKVVEAVRAQVARLQHTCIHVATYEPYVALCETLARRFPHGDATKVLLVNSGAEAVENAVKIARQATGRPGVICFTDAFHGRTLLGMSLTSKVGYKTGCGPFAPEVYRLPFPNHYRSGDGLPMGRFVERELRRFRNSLVDRVGSEQVACVVLEVIQGEGGFVPCPPDYLRGLRRICDETGILLVLDEVQSGFCRTGAWAAYEHAGVTPDLSTWAKAMGGGLPISAVIGRADIMDGARPGTIGGTFGGNPVACASALATISVMEAEDLNARARELGAHMLERLSELKRSCPLVGDLRGLGPMLAIELVHGGDPHRPAKDEAAKVRRQALERDVLVLTAGPHANVLRILPPLTIEREDLDRGLNVIMEEVERVAAENTPLAAGASA